MKVGAGNQTWVLGKSRQCSYAPNHFSIPQQTLLLSLLVFLSYQAIPKTLLATDSLYPVVFLFQIAVWVSLYCLDPDSKLLAAVLGGQQHLTKMKKGK